MPLPSSVQSIALRFTKGNPPTQLSHTQTIPLESIQVGTNASNSVKVDSTFVAAFNAEQEGTIFTPSIVINYGNNITTATSPASGVPNFVPRPPPPIRISRASNNVTIQYTGAAGDVPNNMPLFIEANPRGTGNEWFAVVKQGMRQALINYGNGTDNTPLKRIQGDNSSLVPFNNIVTTLMTDMSFMFYHAYTFNDDVSSWDTSNVLDMNLMFQNAHAFDKPLNTWNVSKVKNMGAMFLYAYVFKKPLNSWDVSKVEDMNYMFYDARLFNQNLSGWNVTITSSRPSLTRNNFADASPLALPENSNKLPPFV